MALIQVATVDETTGKVAAGLLPDVGLSGPQSIDFAFSGNLTAKLGEFKWITPDAYITPTALTVSLGQSPTLNVPHISVFRVRVNGSPLADVTLTGTNSWARSTVFQLPQVPPNSAIQAEVVSLTSHTPVVQAHALVQLWWEYAA